MSLVKHGTYAAWNKHQRSGIPACEVCLAWRRGYQIRYRSRSSTKCVKGLGWPLRRPERVDQLCAAGDLG